MVVFERKPEEVREQEMWILRGRGFKEREGLQAEWPGVWGAVGGHRGGRGARGQERGP